MLPNIDSVGTVCTSTLGGRDGPPKVDICGQRGGGSKSARQLWTSFMDIPYIRWWTFGNKLQLNIADIALTLRILCQLFACSTYHARIEQSRRKSCRNKRRRRRKSSERPETESLPWIRSSPPSLQLIYALLSLNQDVSRSSLNKSLRSEFSGFFSTG